MKYDELMDGWTKGWMDVRDRWWRMDGCKGWMVDE
jgi:hypothetical protein